MKKITSLICLMFFISCLAASASLRIIQAKGQVNTRDIGGRGLCVVSLWDKSTGVPVGADGNFVVMISDSRPQKLWVKDYRMNTRALAIVIPQKPDNLVFDAGSTALALLFQDPNSFGNSREAENISLKAASKKSFGNLVSFLKNSLPTQTLEELMDNDEYLKLLENCNKEVLGQDQAAIRKSLYDAEDKLKKLFND